MAAGDITPEMARAELERRRSGQQQAITPEMARAELERRRIGSDAKPQNGDIANLIQGGPVGYANTYAGQAQSGFAEGLANSAASAGDLLNMSPIGFGQSVAKTAVTAAGNKLGLTDRTGFQKANPSADQIKDALRSIGVIKERSRDKGKQFARRVAQGVGEVAPFAAGGVGGAGRTLVSGAASGAGGGIAQQLFPDSPAAEAVGAVLGGLSPALVEGVAARVSAARDLKKTTPTTEGLKEAAGDLYKKAETQGFTASGERTTGLHASLRQIAGKEGIVTPKSGVVTDTMPKVRAALKMTEEFAGSEMTPEQMQIVRRSLQNAAGSVDAAEARVGSMMLQRFDDFTSGFAPQFKEARKLYHRAKKAEILELAAVRAREKAGAYNQSGYENALRSEYRAIAQQINSGKLKGFTKDELDAIRKVSRGTLASNSARLVGKLAPNGPVSLIPTIAGGATAGPFGAAGVASLGYGGRSLATQLGIDAANTAELLVRSGVRPDKLKAMSPEQIEALAAVLAAQLSHSTTSNGDAPNDQ